MNIEEDIQDMIHNNPFGPPAIFPIDIPPTPPPKQTLPISLHSDVIPSLVMKKYAYTYASLPSNDPPVEKMSFVYCEKITVENFEKILVPGETIVKIPLSSDHFHWKDIKDKGNDRHLVLKFLKANKIHNPTMDNDYQLNFEIMNVPSIKQKYVACRSSKMKSYTYDMFVMHSPEKVNRLRTRMHMIGWKRSIHSIAKQVCEEAVREGDATERQIARIRAKIRGWIATNDY